MGTDVGIFYRNSTLGDWVSFSTGLPNVVVRELEIQQSSKKLWAGTYGRGLWKSDLYSTSASGNAPIITSFSPDNGTTGTKVTIQGNYFAGTTDVKFNGTSATFIPVSSSQLTATVPAGATTGKISVITISGTGNSATNFTITSSSGSAPVITSFTPTTGISGTLVTITGTGFSATAASNTVKFNGTTATVSSATATEIKATVLAGATTGRITVEVGGQTATSATDFVITGNSTTLTITDFSPKAGPAGTAVTITGTNFGATTTNNVVKFNGTIATITSATTTELKVAVASGTTTGKVTVEAGGETATSTADFTITANSTDPAIADFTPKSGIIGTTVTIIGANFGATVADNVVKFNGTLTTITSATTTEIKVTVVAGTTTGKITVETGGKIATSTADFTVTENASDPAVADFTPKSGAKDTVVTIFGNNFDITKINNRVKINGTEAMVTSASIAELKIVVPEGATTGKITVEVGGVTATSTADFTVIDGNNNGIGFSIKPAKVITPNGDLINDTWKIEGIENVSSYHIRVFSKAGQVVYESTNYDTPWDGGSLVAGIYYYNIQMNARGAKENKTGYITIIK